MPTAARGQSSLASDDFLRCCQEVLQALGFGPDSSAMSDGASLPEYDTRVSSITPGKYAHIAMRIDCRYLDVSHIPPTHLTESIQRALSRNIDVLIIIARCSFAPSARRLAAESAETRSCLLILWDQEVVIDLHRQLIQSQESIQNIQRLHAQLLNKARGLQSRATRYQFDCRLNMPYQPLEPHGTKWFVNREREQAELTRFSDYTAAAILGPVGVGKSELARVVLQKARASGFALAEISIRSASTTDAKPAITKISRLLANELHAKALNRHIFQYGWADIQGLIEVTAIEVGKYPTFLLFEDIHQIELGSSLHELLKALCEHPGRTKILTTARPHTTPADLDLQPTVECHLGGFLRQDVRRYLERRNIDAARITDLTTMLCDRHAGWPLYVSLACTSSHPLAPGTHGEVIVDLLAGLRPTTLALARILAIQIDHLHSNELAALMGADQHELQSSWSELYVRGLITHSSIRDSLTAMHDVVRNILISAMPDRTAVEIQLAAFLRTSNMDPERMLTAFEHYKNAGDYTSAARVLVEASDRLIRLGRSRRLLEKSATIDPASVSEIHYMELRMIQSRALEELGDYRGARNLLAEFEVGTMDQLPSLVVSRLMYLRARSSYFLGAFNETRELLQAALLAIAGAGEAEADIVLQKALCCSAMARIFYANRDLATARRLYEKARSLHEKIGDRIGVNKVWHRVAMIELLEGRTEIAKKIFERVRRESIRIGDTKRQSYALHRMGVLARLERDYERAQRYHEMSMEIKRHTGHVRGLVYSGMELGKIAIETGRYADANEHLKLALVKTVTLGLKKEEAAVCRLLGEAEAQAGSPASAARYFARSDEIFRLIDLPSRTKAGRGEDADLG